MHEKDTMLNVKDMTDDQIRSELLKFGVTPGPISSCRKIYEKKLTNLLKSKEKNSEQLQEITDSDLRTQLESYGFQAGPIDKSTRSFYVNKLKKLKFENSTSDLTKGDKESNKFVVQKIRNSPECSRKKHLPVKRVCLSSDENDIEQMDVD